MHKIVAAINIHSSRVPFNGSLMDLAEKALNELTTEEYRAVNPVVIQQKVGNSDERMIVFTSCGGHPPASHESPGFLVLERVFVDDHLQKLRSDLETKFAAEQKEAEARHAKHVEDILKAVKDASQVALREASLELLKDVVTSGVVERLPERLAELVEHKVDAVFKAVRPQ